MESNLQNVSPPSFEVEEEINYVLRLYADRIYRLAFSRLHNQSDAEDIVQEVFIKYMANRERFHTETNEIDETYRKAWLIRVTINCSNSLLRSSWFKKTTALPDDLCTTMEEKSDIYRFVMKLPEKYRTVIHLFYYEELSIHEIALSLDIKESLVKTRLHRARVMLKNLCPDLCEL